MRSNLSVVQPLRDVLSSFGADVRDVRVAKSTTLNICMDYCKRKRTHLLLVCDDALAKSASMKNVVDGETAEKAMGHLDARDAPVIGLATMEVSAHALAVCHRAAHMHLPCAIEPHALAVCHRTTCTCRVPSNHMHLPCAIEMRGGLAN